MAATIAVVYPHMNGLGGDGFWLIRGPNGVVRAIEACGPAGSLATIKRYRDKGYETIPERGPDAALTVAGAVGGWAIAHGIARDLGGRLPLDLILSDAVRHAREGVAVSASEARYVPKELDTLHDQPGFKETFLVDGEPPKAGVKRALPALAATLEQLGHAGLDDFYRGDVGREVAADLERAGSPVTRADIARYRAVSRAPLSLKLSGGTVYNCPPPSQGLAALMILGLYERLGAIRPETAAHYHGLIEATKRAFRVRDAVVTDFDRLRHDPATFLAPERLAAEAAAIRMDRASPYPVRPVGDGDTGGMGAIDGNGVAVSYIQSVYWEFGSGLVLPRTGLTWQNRGIAFSLDPKAVNPLEPGRRPFHTLNPALAVLADGRSCPTAAWAATGSRSSRPRSSPLRHLRHGRRRGGGRAAPPVRPHLGRGLDDREGRGPVRLGLHRGAVADGPRGRGAGRLLHRFAGPCRPAGAPPGNGRIEATHDPRSDGGAAGV